MAAGSVAAEGVEVANYSWLQQSPNVFQAFAGSTNGVVGSTMGVLNNLYTSGYVWIPSTAMTGGGTSTSTGTETYWAGIKLDQSRWIDSVNVQLWAWGPNPAGPSLPLQATVTKFYVEVSNDGSDWSKSVAVDFETPRSFTKGVDSQLTVSLDSLAGKYQYIRVRFAVGDYAGYANFGGPGLTLIDPRGHATLSGTDTVNWANATQFPGVTVKGNGLTDAWSGNIANIGCVINGDLFDIDAQNKRWGVSRADYGDPNRWFEINLGQERTVGEAVGLWDSAWCGNSFQVEYGVVVGEDAMGNDIVNFFPVLHQQPTDGDYASKTQPGQSSITAYTFDAVAAQYWRISTISGVADHALFNEIMLLGPAETVPEPVTTGLLVLGGLALLRRR